MSSTDFEQTEVDPFVALAEVFAGRRALVLEDDPALAEHVADRLLRAGLRGRGLRRCGRGRR